MTLLWRGEADMLINCVAYREGKKLADLDIEEISDYLERPDCFVWVALRDASPRNSTRCARNSTCIRSPSRTPTTATSGRRSRNMATRCSPCIHLLETEHGEIAVGEVDIFVGRNFILSVRNRSGQHLLGVRERCEREPELLRQGSGFVFYALMDAVVDRYFPIVDAFDSELEASRTTSSTRARLAPTSSAFTTSSAA